MLDPKHPFSELLRRDERYKFEAYIFVFDALRFGQDKMGLGDDSEGGETEPTDSEAAVDSSADLEAFNSDDFDGSDIDAELDSLLGDDLADEDERHVTGQQLCHAIQRYTIEQYGLLAQNVLAHWGVHTTADFGEIVFNLIDIGQMRKTDQDRREDFNNVFDFSEAFSNREVFSPEHCSVEKDSDQDSEA